VTAYAAYVLAALAIVVLVVRILYFP
jgi:hypothetical protein